MLYFLLQLSYQLSSILRKLHDCFLQQYNPSLLGVKCRPPKLMGPQNEMAYLSKIFEMIISSIYTIRLLILF